MTRGLFITLIILAIIFGVWMQWYGSRCKACKDRKQMIIDFFGGDKNDSKENGTDIETVSVNIKDLIQQVDETKGKEKV